MEMTFAAGEAVEVRSADGAAWIEARVVRPFLLSRRYVVAYDNGTFNETYPSDRVRPRPSPAAAGGAAVRFRLYQLVEAFSGGWWRSGVVSKVHAASEEWRYDVCFPEKREEWEFGSGAVRPKLDWADGEWVPAEKKETAETLHSMGTLVEVASVSKKLPVAWYPAIVTFVVDKNIFVVEYETLRSHNGSSLKEIIASKDVRPYPPCASRCEKFNLLDEVEAFYRNGWWPGVVAKVNTGSRYNVKFLHWEEEIEFDRADLRLLYDWVDRQWVQASQDKSIKSQVFGGKKSDGHTQLFHASSSHIYKVPVIITPLSSDGDEALCKLPTSPRNVDYKNSDILTYQSKLESPCKKSKKGETTEDNRRLLDFVVVDRGPNTSSRVNAEVDVSTSTQAVEVEPNFRIKALAEKHYSRNPSKTMNMVSQDTATKSSSNILLGDVNDDSLIHEKLSQTSSLLHAPDSIIGLVDKAEEFLEPAAKLSGTSGFLRAAEWEQHEGVCSMVDGEKRIRLDSKHQSLGDEGVRHLTLGEKRRKNSRPRKLTIVEPALEGDSIRNQRDDQAVGKPPSEGLSTSRPEALTQGGASAEGLEALDLLNSTVASPEASCVETSVSGAQFSETGSETQKEVLNTIRPPTKVVPSKQASGLLPFEKRSSTWDLIESMEIFSRIPQQPHFRPLNQQCKELREGLAIGLMVTFSNSVNSIGQLRITDPRNKFDEGLKVLLQLEAHGFDVEPVRSRITELLRMKDDLEQVTVRRSEVRATLTERKKEREQLNVQIESVGKFVMEFEQSLSKIQDLRNSIAKQRSMKNSEVEKLQADARTVEDALQSAERVFEATSTIYASSDSLQHSF